MQPVGCPPNTEELAEAYAMMGTLDAADAEAFEAHPIACAACAGVLPETGGYVDAMQAAARTVRLSIRS